MLCLEKLAMCLTAPLKCYICDDVVAVISAEIIQHLVEMMLLLCLLKR